MHREQGLHSTTTEGGLLDIDYQGSRVSSMRLHHRSWAVCACASHSTRNAGYHHLTDDLGVESRLRKLLVAEYLSGPICHGPSVSWVFDKSVESVGEMFTRCFEAQSEMELSQWLACLFHLITDSAICQDRT